MEQSFIPHNPRTRVNDAIFVREVSFFRPLTMATERTPHECPISKALIYNELPTFHDHLNTSCAKTLFSYLTRCGTTWRTWSRNVILPAATSNTSATVLPTPRQQRRAPMDLEELDRDISVLHQKEKQRHRQEAQQRKRRRVEMKREIGAELRRAARGARAQVADMRPPKRVSLDAAMCVDVLTHKVRLAGRDYHDVAHRDLTSSSGDHKAPVMHSQRALTRYLKHCAALCKCLDARLFAQVASKFERVRAPDTILKALWTRFGEEEEKAKDEAFWWSWDAVSEQKEM